MNLSMKRALVVAAAATAAVTTSLASTAFAAQGDFNSSGVRIRSYPINGTVYGLGYPGQGDYAYAGIDCTNGYVNGDDYWDWNKDLATGVTGYSADALLTEYADSYTYTGTPC
jgi:hypothetical protein